MDYVTLSVLLVLGIVPPLVFLVWMRNREHEDREPYSAVLKIFFYGATVGVMTAFVLNTLFGTGAWLYSGDVVVANILTAVLSAPIVEEAVKASGLSLKGVRKHLTEHEDGIVYGAAVGLGFAMSENLVYGFSALADDTVTVAITVMVVRVFSSTILHAAASALVGFSISRTLIMQRSKWRIVPFYLAAVLLHASYNLLVSAWILFGFLAAVTIVWVVLGAMRREIARLEALPHHMHAIEVPPEQGRPPS